MSPLTATRKLAPEQNLHLYATNAKLTQLQYHKGPRGPPKPPKPGHKSHRNLLHSRPEHWRLLNTVFRFKPDSFAEIILAWHDKYFPKTPINFKLPADDKFGVYAPGFNAPEGTLTRVGNLSKVSHWVEMIVMQTALSMIHAAFPDTMHMSYSSDESRILEVDGDLIQEVYMVNTNPEATPEPYYDNLTPVVVFVQGAWVLSPRDFEQFTARRNVNALQAKAKKSNERLRSSDRLWGKIWDYCANTRCHFFVVTTYEQWAFGRFSDGWQSAFVSPPIAWNAKGPTVLQCLTYWMMSSVGVKDGFVNPEVGDTERGWTEPYFRMWDLTQLDKRKTDLLWRLSREE